MSESADDDALALLLYTVIKRKTSFRMGSSLDYGEVSICEECTYFKRYLNMTNWVNSGRTMYAYMPR